MDVDAIWSLIIFLALVVLQAVLQGFLTALEDSQIDNYLDEEDENATDARADLLHIRSMTEKMRPTGILRAAADMASVTMAVIMGATMISGVIRIATTKIMDGANSSLPLFSWLIFVILFLAALALYVLLGYLLPRKFAGRSPVKWVKNTWRMVWILCIIMIIPAALAQLLATVLLRLFGQVYDKDEENVTEEEIITMVNEGHEQGVLEADAAEMITNIFEYGDKQAEDIMTHRVAIHSIKASVTLADALHEIAKANNSRFPVCGEDLDDVLGILHMKDAIVALEDPDNIHKKLSEIPDLLHTPTFISQTKNIDDLFREMQTQKNHIVIVLDEYGQTSGLITMEDILEEIVGNIMDEYDQDEDFIRKQEDGSYLMSGMTPLEEVCETLSLELEEESEEFDTLSGFMIYRIDHIPGKDEHSVICEGDYRFEVLSSDKGIIRNIRVSKNQKVEAAASKE